jgi:hypothetical protein
MYHSALKSFKQYDKESYGFETSSITGLIFDIETDSIPEVFYKAEFVYLEFPYRKGYEVFNDRVNKKGVGFGYLQLMTLEILNKLDKPFYIIAEKRMPILEPLLVDSIYYSAHKCDTYLYSNKPIKAKSTNELQSLLFQTYNIGLDFMCGYGNIVGTALEHNKKVIVSDINPKCLGYIYENLQEK